MKKRAVIAATGLLVLMVPIGLLLWWPPPIQTGAAPQSTPGPSDSQDVQAGVHDTRSAVAVDSKSALTGSPALGTIALRGTVIRVDDSSPVQYALVKAHAAGTFYTASTDRHGRYEIAFDAATRISLLGVDATETTASVQKLVRLVVGPGTVVEHTLYVSSGSTLEGLVVDQLGHPIPFARVLGWCQREYPLEQDPDRNATADSSGHFILRNLGEWFHVAAEAPELCCAFGLRGSLRAQEAASGVQITLTPCGSISGHVVDQHGTPLEGAKIEVAGGADGVSSPTHVPGIATIRWGASHAITDSQGYFATGTLADDGRERLCWAEHDQCIGQHGAIQPSIADNRVVLERGVDITGRVLSPQGLAVPGATVQIGHVRGHSRTVKTAGDGTFVAHGVDAAAVSVIRIRAAGFAIHVRDSLDLSRSPALEFRLEPAKSLLGRVLDVSGLPVVNAPVHIEGDREVKLPGYKYSEKTTWEWFMGDQHGSTDSSGHFAFDDLYDGRFRVRAGWPDDPLICAEAEARPGRGEVKLILDRAAHDRVTLVGRVLDSTTLTPVGRFSVLPLELRGDERSGVWREFAGPEGQFRINGLLPGSIRIMVTSPGHARCTMGEQQFSAGQHSLEVVLEAARTIRLKVVGADGSSVSGRKWVYFESLTGERLWIDTGVLDSADSISVADQPTAITGLPATVIRAVLTVESRQPQAFEIDLRDIPQGPVELRLAQE